LGDSVLPLSFDQLTPNTPPPPLFIPFHFTNTHIPTKLSQIFSLSSLHHHHRRPPPTSHTTTIVIIIISNNNNSCIATIIFYLIFIFSIFDLVVRDFKTRLNYLESFYLHARMFTQQDYVQKPR
jgi:hypothetical protein